MTRCAVPWFVGLVLLFCIVCRYVALVFAVCCIVCAVRACGASFVVPCCAGRCLCCLRCFGLVGAVVLCSPLRDARWCGFALCIAVLRCSGLCFFLLVLFVPVSCSFVLCLAGHLG